MATSPHDPGIVYFGTQILLKSTDRGTTWAEISGDLTRNDPEKQGRNGGPLTPENVGAEFYNTIFYIVESPAEPGTIWVGSDDGLVHLTRNGGESWADVSPEHSDEAQSMGEAAREHVRENFLITRHLRDYLGLFNKMK